MKRVPRCDPRLLGAALVALTSGIFGRAVDVRGAEPPRAAPAAATPPSGASLHGAHPAAPARREQALVVGSSSVSGSLGRLIEQDLQRWGYRVTRRGIVSAGLARPDFCDLRAVLDGMPISEHTAGVFVYVGVNDAQALWLRPSERSASGERWLSWQDPRWAEVYTQRAHGLLRSICERGAQRAIVLLPIDVEKGSLQRKLQRIRLLQTRAAREAGCAVPVSTAGDGGRFSRNGQRLRRPDGFHMTPLGARVVWHRVQDRALLLGLPVLRSREVLAVESASGRAR